MSGLDVRVVAVDRELYRGQADSVVAPAADGQVGILPGHTPLLAILAPGEVRIARSGGEPVHAQVAGGFLSVDRDVVTIVTDGGSLEG